MKTLQVKTLPTKPIYHLGNYTGDNVAIQTQIEPPRSRAFRWEELGIDLMDLEALAEVV